jgi:hypothetical protein
MKLKHWQIVWEVIAYTIAGGLLILNIISPSFKHVVWFLVIEYIIDLFATIAYWRWVSSIDDKHES